MKEDAVMSEQEYSFVAFVDLMGYCSNLAEKNQTNAKSIVLLRSRLKTYLTTALATLSNMKEKEISECINYETMTDCVYVYITPNDKFAHHIAVLSLFYAVSKVYWDLVNMGRLLRGGITAGNISVYGNGVFDGHAVVRAYDLESKYANAPGIAVDKLIFSNELLVNLCTLMHNLTNNKRYLYFMLSLDSFPMIAPDFLTPYRLGDFFGYEYEKSEEIYLRLNPLEMSIASAFFIQKVGNLNKKDYLNYFESAASIIIGAVASQKNLILSGIKDHNRDERLYSKYYVFKVHHNESIRKMKDFLSTYSSKCKILKGISNELDLHFLK